MADDKHFLCRRCGWITDEIGKAPHESLCSVTEMPASMRWQERPGALQVKPTGRPERASEKRGKNSYGDDVEG